MSIRACSPSSLPAVFLFGLAGCYSSHHAVGDVESDVCCDPDIVDEGVMDPLETDEQEETPDLPPPDTWLVMLGEENFGWSFSAAQDGEGGIMAVGTRTPQVIDLASDPLGLDFWILRIDGQGRSVWQAEPLRACRAA